MLDTESQSKIIVEVFDAALNAMKKLGLSHEEALNGILSQISVQVELSSLEHAIELNKKYRDLLK
tara:strand:+ start:1109 stop:1303 length:195 start_codon:yes stop_codon:yes gene_type:complete